MQYLHVRALVDEVALDLTRPDLFHWRWSPSGLYSASSAYQATFQGHTTLFRARELWKVEVPTSVVCLFGLSCRIGAGRLNGDADMVFRTMMTMLFALSWPSPLITSWSAAHSVVKSGLNAFVELVGMGWPLQLGSAGFALWWLRTRKRLRRDHRKCFNSIAVLVAWKLAGPREDFRGECSLSPTFLVYEITQDFELWCRADLIPRSSLPAS
jgi:hypothetical protein